MRTRWKRQCSGFWKANQKPAYPGPWARPKYGVACGGELKFSASCLIYPRNSVPSQYNVSRYTESNWFWVRTNSKGPIENCTGVPSSNGRYKIAG